VLIYAVTIFTSAFLLFEVQPMMAHSKPLESVRKVRAWTDDFSNLFQILK
jgi:hypothetical protein